MDFALIGLIIVVGFVLALMLPRPGIKVDKKEKVQQQPERLGRDVPSSSQDSEASASHPSTRAA